MLQSLPAAAASLAHLLAPSRLEVGCNQAAAFPQAAAGALAVVQHLAGMARTCARTRDTSNPRYTCCIAVGGRAGSEAAWICAYRQQATNPCNNPSHSAAPSHHERSRWCSSLLTGGQERGGVLRWRDVPWLLAKSAATCTHVPGGVLDAAQLCGTAVLHNPP